MFLGVLSSVLVPEGLGEVVFLNLPGHLSAVDVEGEEQYLHLGLLGQKATIARPASSLDGYSFVNIDVLDGVGDFEVLTFGLVLALLPADLQVAW